MLPFYFSLPNWLNSRLTGIASMVIERLVLNLDVLHVSPNTFIAKDLTDGIHLNKE